MFGQFLFNLRFVVERRGHGSGRILAGEESVAVATATVAVVVVTSGTRDGRRGDDRWWNPLAMLIGRGIGVVIGIVVIGITRKGGE